MILFLLGPFSKSSGAKTAKLPGRFFTPQIPTRGKKLFKQQQQQQRQQQQQQQQQQHHRHLIGSHQAISLCLDEMISLGFHLGLKRLIR